MIENGSIIYEDSNLDFWTFDILGLVVIVAVVDRTEPNLPNTEASVRYYSVRFGSVRSRNTEPKLCY